MYEYAYDMLKIKETSGFGIDSPISIWGVTCFLLFSSINWPAITRCGMPHIEYV